MVAFDLLCDQRTAGWIAGKLFISMTAVDVCIKNIYCKCSERFRQELFDLLGGESRVWAACCAHECGMAGRSVAVLDSLLNAYLFYLRKLKYQ